MIFNRDWMHGYAAKSQQILGSPAAIAATRFVCDSNDAGGLRCPPPPPCTCVYITAQLTQNHEKPEKEKGEMD